MKPGHSFLVLATAAAACAGGGADQSRGAAAARGPSSSSATRTPQANTALRHTSEAGGEVANDSATAVTPRWITDANILALLGDMNAAQIAAASAELQAWGSDTVRAFAANVARTHSDLQHSVDSLSARLRMTPVRPALAASFDSTLRSASDSVAGLKGTALDRAFLRGQIARAQTFADYIDQLASVAESPDVQTLLTMAATRVGSELGGARTLQASVAMADSAAADSAAQRAGRSKRRAAAR